MGQSNVLLRIYYVKDFPLHTLLLEIRKGYFMEPENKFATAGRKRWRRRGREEKKKKQTEKGRWNFAVSSRQQTMRTRSRGGWANLFKKKKMIASRFSFSFSFFLSLFPPPVLPRYVSNPCLVFLQKVCSANAFQKPFFKAQWENIAIEV